MEEIILSIDQGTSSSRAFAFDATGAVHAHAQREFPQYFPQDGWVEHDAQEIWQSTRAVCLDVLAQTQAAGDNVVGVAITNQRETLLVWERATGKPIGKAIVWQDRRTADMCDALRPTHEADFHAKTGLLFDPYFSMSKLAWLLDNVAGARTKAEAGALAFGTIDTWLVWQLTNGAVHCTDATNAARTGLFNIHKNCWDEDLLALFNIPPSLLPQVQDNAAAFGTTTQQALGVCLPICAMAGDQQAAAIGQACFAPAMIKSTYGTGCFMLAHTGQVAVASENRLLTTIAYRLKGKTYYALEGSIFMAGAIVQWLRDGLRLIDHADETQSMAENAAPDSKVVCIPAFTGLGAPHWQPHARAALLNMTRATEATDIVRAALEAVSHQSDDLLAALMRDMATADMLLPPRIRIDGGMVANDWFCQNLADICDCPIDRPRVIETTALGVAMLAFLQLGVFKNIEDISVACLADQAFTPQKTSDWRQNKRDLWQAGLAQILSG